MHIQIDRYRYIDTNAPTLGTESIVVGGRELWRVWCESCRAWHYHGAAPGHRVAHCDSGGYTETGYNLQPPHGWDH